MHQAHGLPVLTLPALSRLTYEVQTYYPDFIDEAAVAQSGPARR